MGFFRSEEKFRETEECLRLIVEEVKDFAIILIDTDGNVMDWNAGAERMLGYKESEVVGKPADIIFTQADRENKKPEEEFREARQRGRGPDERWHVRKDGSVFWGTGSVTPLYSKEGELKAYVKIFRDLTDYKKMADDLRRSNQELQQFAYTISHDLQEPLRVIANYSDLLKKKLKDKVDRDASEYIEYLAESSVRAENLIRALLNLSRFGSSSRKFESVNFETIVKDVLKNLQMKIEEKKAKIVFSSLPVLKADPNQITQLFQNLITNAIKYNNSPRPEIRIDASEEETEWIFSVQDNGPGIPVQDRERIFDPFTRLDYERPGSGLGLAICKKIVGRHSGRIWVEENPQGGATFYFSIPNIRV